MSQQWVRPPENNAPLDLRPSLREGIVRLLVEALEDDDPVSHTIDSTLNRGRELCVRCLCGWESHWWPSYTAARQQFEIHEELHAHD